MSGFPVNGKFGLFPRFEAEKSKKNGKSAFIVKFLTVIKKKVKVSAVEVKEGDGRMGQFENGAKKQKICEG